jgi:hypothetical protein
VVVSGSNEHAFAATERKRRIHMKNRISVCTGVALGLCFTMVSAPSYARYTFGRIRAEVGGTIARDESASCASRVQDNLKEEIISRHANGTEDPHEFVWGQSAKDDLGFLGLPVEIDDDGMYTCTQYTGNVYLHFQYPDGGDFWVTATPGQSFSTPFWVSDARIQGSLVNGGLGIYKKMGCSGDNEWHTSVGTGSLGGSWVDKVTYFKSGY